MSETVWLFVAADLPAEVVEALPRGADPPWRAVAPGSVHLTLAFLGSVPADSVPVVAGALRAAFDGGVAPVPLRLLQSIGLPPRRPRVLAVEVDDPSGGLRALQARVASSLVAAGVFEPERRPFLAHVTVGRARGPVGGGDLYLDVAPLEFAVPSVTLYASRPGPGGSDYSVLERVRLT